MLSLVGRCAFQAMETPSNPDLEAGRRSHAMTSLADDGQQLRDVLESIGTTHTEVEVLSKDDDEFVFQLVIGDEKHRLANALTIHLMLS
jgi:hypothetical protein